MEHNSAVAGELSSVKSKTTVQVSDFKCIFKDKQMNPNQWPSGKECTMGCDDLIIPLLYQEKRNFIWHSGLGIVNRLFFNPTYLILVTKHTNPSHFHIWKNLCSSPSIHGIWESERQAKIQEQRQSASGIFKPLSQSAGNTTSETVISR